MSGIIDLNLKYVFTINSLHTINVELKKKSLADAYAQTNLTRLQSGEMNNNELFLNGKQFLKVTTCVICDEFVISEEKNE